MPDNLHKGAKSKLFSYAKQNRKKVTDAENILWSYLRNKKLEGYKFRRQHPIADFVADFFCLECNLVIEVDGGYHQEIEQKQYDAGRTYVLGEFKVKVLRFANLEVIEQTDFVLNVIREHLSNSKSTG